MVDDPIYSDRDVFEQAGAGLVATLTLAATPPGHPFPSRVRWRWSSLIGLGFGRSVYKTMKRRLPLFARAFLSGADPDLARAEEKAKAAAKQVATESLDDIMMRAFRQMMDAVDDSVVPVLGHMAGLYGFEGKKPNHFFRALVTFSPNLSQEK